MSRTHKLDYAEASVNINVPIESLNLGEWMFTLTSDEYVACSKDHRAATQSMMPNGKRLSVNVEIIGGLLTISHYEEDVTTRDKVIGLSKNTVVFTDRVPAGYIVIQVEWELEAKKIDDNTTKITCKVETSTKSRLMQFLGKLEAKRNKIPAAQTPLQLHINEEAPLFAKDIER